MAIARNCYLEGKGEKCSGIHPLNPVGMGYGKYPVSIKAVITVADVF